MMTITPEAAQALDALAASGPEIAQRSPQACVRLIRATGSDGQPGFQIGLAAAPAPTDVAIDAPSEVVVMAEPEVAAELQDKLLDARLDGESVAFVLS